MKRTTFIITAIIAIASCSAPLMSRGNETLIMNPEFDASDTNYMMLSKIERTDTATIIYADVYNLPNYWIYLSSNGKLKDSKGKTYKLLSCDGFQLDKEVFMPASGTMSFALYFEPVDKNEKMVDYIDLDENNESIIGIKLYKVRHTEPVQCLLKGEVLDRPQSSRLVLLKSGRDFRTTKVTYIPVRDGKFEYMFYANAEEAYQLIFDDEIRRGFGHPVDFIAESGTLDFTLNPIDKWQDNTVKGGKYTGDYHAMVDSLNKKMRPFYHELDEKMQQLQDENKYYTPEAGEIYKQLQTFNKADFATKKSALYDRIDQLKKEGKYLSEEARVLHDEGERIYKTVYVDNLLEYAKTHVNIMGYTFLVKITHDAIEQEDYKLDAAPMLAIFHDIYEKKYPRHPYTSLMQSYGQAAAIQAGKPCPDVAALDVTTDREVRLLELMKGKKVTLIHLWASWCGPCRAHGMAMIPVYEMYKDKGFSVIGISREQKKEAMDMAVKKDKYPWVNLLELNDEHSIWTKFGIGNAGGGEFLVDAQGNFLAVNATPEEMKKILQKLFD
ncbi:MAG: TlpA family protein disulfide reductase [Dysgonamonadaceae bacterium]|jgi:thiol-disulfide isomerase/thioredoxin|nr:TlpA family protein disulfide reductase [Dysgonamonadaceae bacterium]